MSTRAEGAEGASAVQSGTPLPVSLTLLGISLAISLGLAIAGVPVMEHSSIVAIVGVGFALAALRILWACEPGGSPRQTVFFWANLAISAVAIVLSPVFGLYLFLSFYEASIVPGPQFALLRLAGTAAVIAVAQIGGIRSPIFTPLVYLLFVAVNLGIAGLMWFLDRQRQALTDEVSAANAELRAEKERSEALRERLVAQARESGIQEERSRLSREIHDTVAQDLVGIIAQLDAAQHAPDEERDRRLAVVDATAREALAEARRAVHALASPRLDDADLPAALGALAGQWQASTGVEAALAVEGDAVAGAHDDDLLRVAQEALANVARHAGAGKVELALAYRGGEASLTVSDDGAGFDPEETPAGHGLAGMRERLGRIGGTMVLMSAPGEGTVLVARVPLEEG